MIEKGLMIERMDFDNRFENPGHPNCQMHSNWAKYVKA